MNNAADRGPQDRVNLNGMNNAADRGPQDRVNLNGKKLVQIVVRGTA